MKLFYLVLITIVFSCAPTKKIKKIYLSDLVNKNQIYYIKDNSYFYFMIDSTNTKYLIKTSILNSSEVVWMEKLNQKNKN